MRNFPKLSSTLFATGMAALLLGNLALPNSAQASLEYNSDSANSGDNFLTFHNSYGKDVMAKSRISVDDVEKLMTTVKTNTAEIDTLKKPSANKRASSKTSNATAVQAPAQVPVKYPTSSVLSRNRIKT